MNKMKRAYDLAKDAKVGERVCCPSCGSVFTKSHYAQAFCKSKAGTICKDRYWNTVTPSKRNNTARLSASRVSYLDNQARNSGFPDHATRVSHVDDFDGSWDAHYSNVENCEYCGMKPEYCECGDFFETSDL